MSRLRRSHAPGTTFFFTVNTRARQSVLTTPLVRQALREVITEVRLGAPFIVHAWVLLPDHLHCILGAAAERCGLLIGLAVFNISSLRERGCLCA